MRVALVCSWLNQYGGAERVLEAVHSLYPQAPIYTSIHDPAAMPVSWRTWDIRASWMNRLPAVNRYSRLYLPFYAAAFSGMTLPGYDVTLSISSGFANAVSCPDGPQICYCLTPPRFLWGLQEYVQREQIRGWQRLLLKPLLAYLRRWDLRAAEKVQYFLTTSHEVQQRISAIYQRQAPIIFPPVETERLSIREDVGDYLLVVSRLVPYKRIDLAVQACNRLKLPLKIVGEGRARAQLEAMAGPTVQFLGWRPDEEVSEMVAHCRAFIFPGLEDFGITPLESQAAGRPVIAFAGGGALETIIDGETGVLFPEQTVDSLCAGIERGLHTNFDPQRLRQHALGFDTKVFQQRLREYVETCLAD